MLDLLPCFPAILEVSDAGSLTTVHLARPVNCTKFLIENVVLVTDASWFKQHFKLVKKYGTMISSFLPDVLIFSRNLMENSTFWTFEKHVVHNIQYSLVGIKQTLKLILMLLRWCKCSYKSALSCWRCACVWFLWHLWLVLPVRSRDFHVSVTAWDTYHDIHSRSVVTCILAVTVMTGIKEIWWRRSFEWHTVG